MNCHGYQYANELSVSYRRRYREDGVEQLTIPPRADVERRPLVVDSLKRTVAIADLLPPSPNTPDLWAAPPTVPTRPVSTS